MSELKPCLFCGGKASIREYASGHTGNGEFSARYKVWCENCGIFFDKESKFTLEKGLPKFSQNGYETAVNAWNKRYKEDEQ